MTIGKRKREPQGAMWIARTELPTPPGHPFYQRLTAVLDERGFDQIVEQRSSKFYGPRMGRPSVAPGVYIRRKIQRLR